MQLGVPSRPVCGVLLGGVGRMMAFSRCKIKSFPIITECDCVLNGVKMLPIESPCCFFCVPLGKVARMRKLHVIAAIVLRLVLNQRAGRRGAAAWIYWVNQSLCEKASGMNLGKIRKTLAQGVPVIVFVVLVGSSALASVGSYCAAQSRIEGDLRRALAGTIAAKGSYYASADTVRVFSRMQAVAGGGVAVCVADAVFRSNIADGRLRDSAYLQVDVFGDKSGGGHLVADGGGRLATEAVVLRSADGASAVVLRGCASCSRASVLMISDQRLSLLFFVSALFWAAGCVTRRRHLHGSQSLAPTFGGLTMSADGTMFLCADGEPLRLTPMQHRLLAMFFVADGHRLSHGEICDALWPKKPDASATLYTLIKRLRAVVESHGSLRIESDRGQAYRLVDR